MYSHPDSQAHQGARVRSSARIERQASSLIPDRAGVAPVSDNPAPRLMRPAWRVVAAAALDAARHHGLTPRETDVLVGVCYHRADHEIAARLGITRRTVRMHLSNLCGRIGLERVDRSQLARFVLRWKVGA